MAVSSQTSGPACTSGLHPVVLTKLDKTLLGFIKSPSMPGKNPADLPWRAFLCHLHAVWIGKKVPLPLFLLPLSSAHYGASLPGYISLCDCRHRPLRLVSCHYSLLTATDLMGICCSNPFKLRACPSSVLNVQVTRVSILAVLGEK